MLASLFDLGLYIVFVSSQLMRDSEAADLVSGKVSIFTPKSYLNKLFKSVRWKGFGVSILDPDMMVLGVGNMS